MALILNIETSASVCSVALSNNNEIISYKESNIINSHASILGSSIDEILREQNILVQDLDAVAVSRGPGSYTGLRIGVSTAKGICFGASKPLIAIGTLNTIVHGFLNEITKRPMKYGSVDDLSLLCPMIDARRMEVYTALFDSQGIPVSEIIAEVVIENAYNEILDKRKIYFFGNGAMKCKSLINHPNAIFVEGIDPLARYMPVLSLSAFNHKKFEDVAYFEPFYLKDFVTTISKKKLL